MHNHQPFYHRATVLFTCTEPVSESEFCAWLSDCLKKKRGVYVPYSLEIEEWAEPGDSADLM